MKSRKLAFLWSIALGIWSSPALGQSREDLLRCRTITDDPQRLACYDALDVRLRNPPGKYEPVALEDLSEGPLAYRGRLVEVTGHIGVGTAGFSLYLLGSNGREIPLDIGALPRRERESLQQSCAGGCDGTVQGRVAPVRFVTGIVADAVLVR